jgi:hypothetical protein
MDGQIISPKKLSSVSSFGRNEEFGSSENVSGLYKEVPD